MDDSKNEQFPVCRAKNKQETVIAGLLGQPPHFQLDVVVFEGKGRGVVVREGVPKGAYVCEYPATLTYPRKERAGYEEEYTRNGEGCYILDCLMRDGWVCLDGTRSYSGVGRYLNHVPRSVATLTPYKPLLINGKWRVGFTATRDLLEGDELTWDYGCAPGGQDWLRRRPHQKCRKTAMLAQFCYCVYVPIAAEGKGEALEFGGLLKITM